MTRRLVILKRADTIVLARDTTSGLRIVALPNKPSRLKKYLQGFQSVTRFEALELCDAVVIIYRKKALQTVK